MLTLVVLAPMAATPHRLPTRSGLRDRLISSAPRRANVTRDQPAARMPRPVETVHPARDARSSLRSPLSTRPACPTAPKALPRAFDSASAGFERKPLVWI